MITPPPPHSFAQTGNSPYIVLFYLVYYLSECNRGGNKKIFTPARLASEPNFTLASEDLYSRGDENMQNENQCMVDSADAPSKFNVDRKMQNLDGFSDTKFTSTSMFKF